MYLMAVAHRRDIRSIRDLKPTHVGFLEHLHKRIMEGVPAKYPNVNADQLKIYVHYQPSYYHFHVHVVHVSHDMGGSGAIGKAMLLDSIIETLHLMQLAEEHGGLETPVVVGYKDLKISYVIGEEHELWQKVFAKLNAGEEPFV